MSAEMIARRRKMEAAGKLKLPGFQWLTCDAKWEQPFCFLGNLPYPKNAYRITVTIPEAVWRRLHEWKELCARCRPDSEPFINQKSVDWENWWVFYGPIFPAWILEIERNPSQPIIATEHGSSN